MISLSGLKKIAFVKLFFAFSVFSVFAQSIIEEKTPTIHKRGVYKDVLAMTAVTYKTVDSQSLQFDITYPQTNAPESGFPLIVYIHGGAWSGGERQEGYGFFNDEIRYYNSEGIAVATVSYRFINPHKKLTIEDCVIDVKDALRFITKNSSALKINSRKIGIYGHSAGGHLTMMAALSSNDEFYGDPCLKGVNVKIVCAVPMSGPSSFTDAKANFPDKPSILETDICKRFFGAPPKSPEAEKVAKLVSPVEYLKKNSPPMLVINGEKDNLVSENAAIYIVEKAREIGAPLTLLIAKNAGHSFENGDHVAILNARRNFFLKYLKD